MRRGTGRRNPKLPQKIAKNTKMKKNLFFVFFAIFCGNFGFSLFDLHYLICSELF